MDPELKAMASIQRTLHALAPAQRKRVLLWIKNKDDEGGGEEQAAKNAAAAAATN